MAKHYIRPFLKWAGGKYRLLPHILSALPTGKRLLEPFAGSAVIFLNTNYSRYRLNDTNQDLINLYQLLKVEKFDFINHAAKLFNKRNNHPDKYYQLRKRFNLCDDIYERSLLFLYLNRHGYNGLCRYNQSGGFNVPFGRYIKPYFPANEMAIFYEKAKKATFTCMDFTKMMKRSRQGDVIYCDPPYVPLSETAYFTNYYHQNFSKEAQEQLTTMAQTLSQKNIPVLISNHHTHYTEKLYKKADITSFSVRRNISCQGNKRVKVRELLAKF